MPLNVNKDDKKKKKKYMGALGVREMLKKFEKEKEASKKQDDVKGLPMLQTLAVIPHKIDSSSINNVSDPLLSLIGSANDGDLLHVASTVDLEIDLDRLLNDSSPGSPLNDFDDGSDPLPTLQYSTVGQIPKQVPTLPEGLPSLLEKCIKELTRVRSQQTINPLKCIRDAQSKCVLTFIFKLYGCTLRMHGSRCNL